MLNWVIIGGGIHGTYLANLLVNQIGVDHRRLRILDPQPLLLHTWSRNTANSGMRHLRSPATHQIDLPILSLYRFAKSLPDRSSNPFIPPYNRPALSLFQTHSRHVVMSNKLDALHIRGRALALKRTSSHFTVIASSAELQTQNILLAIGLGEQPLWPHWATRIRRQSSRVRHVFEPDFDRQKLPTDQKTVVIGGGITAVQLALRLSMKSPPGSVTILSPHKLRESFYDFDPCWIGPKCLTEFYPLTPEKRRKVIDRARITGSLPPEVMAELDDAVAEKRLEVVRGQVNSAEVKENRFYLQTEKKRLQTDWILLATGFESHRPGGRFIDQIIAGFNLPCNSCGYPIVDENLQWDEKLFVSGPLAELQVGPCARNIIGARNAGRRLLEYLGNGI